MKNSLWDKKFGNPSAELFDFSPVWDQLRYRDIPNIIRKQPEGAILKAWVIACSTGEVAY